MWNNEDILKEFHYYNEEGVFIGKSEGSTPQQDLFDKAHYVFDDESEIIKNQDLLISHGLSLLVTGRKKMSLPRVLSATQVCFL